MEWATTLALLQVIVMTITLIVLCVYAYDTRRIAQASVAQTENSQKPFLVLLQKPQQVGQHPGGWALENQGFGPAINIRHTEVVGVEGFRENVRALAANSDFFFLEGFNIDVMRNHVFVAEYESLSGKKYRTVVDWPEHVMRTVLQERE